MRITKEQEELLDSLECRRLSSSRDNLYLVDDFYNTRNASLVTTLQNEAFEEDENGDMAYYSHQLKFTLDTERATVKPLYDLSCKFMYQETKDIDKRRSLFFENLNEDE